MVTTRRNKTRDLNALLRAATDLHGHFGPFLVLGVRMSLIGLRELGIREGDMRLHVAVRLKYAHPFSCILDGVQTAAKCTVGNKRLAWIESKDVGAIFSLTNNGERVEVNVNSAVVQELIRRLEGKQSFDEEVHRLALEVVSRREEELFSVRHK